MVFLARETKSDSDIAGTRSNPETVAQSRLFLTRFPRTFRYPVR